LPGGTSTEIIAAPVEDESKLKTFSKKYAYNNFKVKKSEY
jgi:hypothetical protein